MLLGCLMAVHAKNEPGSKLFVYLDTTHSNNMTGTKSLFNNLNKNFWSIVSFGNLSIVNDTRKGCINFRTKNRCVEIISNVFFVPTLKNKLLSVDQLLEKRICHHVKECYCEISNPPRCVIGFVKMNPNECLPLKIENCQSCYVKDLKNPLWLRNFRYGNLNFGVLQILQKMSTVTGLYEIVVPFQVCDECVVRK